MSKYTRGPWTVNLETNTIETDRETVVAFAGEFKNPTKKQLANARLIAAAPDLLDFVNRFADDLYCDADQINNTHAKDCICCTARALLSKIEGE
jgi:hypothetical protein